MSESRSFKQATQSLFAWFVVFVCGFCLMTTELLASRLVAPYLGLSLDVWTGIIAFVLIGVILGVLLGGWMADRAKSVLLLPVILGAATVSLAMLPRVTPLFFRAWGTGGWSEQLLGSLALLLVLPACLLVLPQPILARAEILRTGAAGQAVGRISAAQSLGSILGTFLSGFIFLSIVPAPLVATVMVGVLAVLTLVSCVYAFSFSSEVTSIGNV